MSRRNMEGSRLVVIVVARRFVDPWKPIDPLAEALRVFRLSGVFYCRSELTAPWALSLPPFPQAMMFHIVTGGSSWVEVDGTEPRLLRPGQLALVPHGQGHILRGDTPTPPVHLFDASRQLLSDRYEVLRLGGGGTTTTMLCGLVRCEHPAAEDIRRWLPGLICLERGDSSRQEWVTSTLQLVSDEAVSLRPGADELIRRLADILVLEAVRSWIDLQTGDTAGWLGALRDPQIGQALVLIQREPSERWTVDSLARACGMSRSAFAARFTTLVGMPVKQYVTRWRMHEATLLLDQDRTSLAELAERLGYSDEAAFSRAFKRVTGRSPGALKRRRAGAVGTIGHDRWMAGHGVTPSSRA